MTPEGLIVCALCKHYNSGEICPAFPDGIPEIILSGENDHSKPLPDQGNDIVFEEIKKAGQ